MKFFYFVLVAVFSVLPSGAAIAQDALVVAMYHKGHALLENRDNARAIAFLEDATAQDPTMVNGWVDLGHCRVNLGKPEVAIEALKKAIKLDPSRADAHYYLGEAYSMMSQYPQALDEYKHAVTIQPKLTDAYFSMGIADIAVGDRSAAEKELLHLQVMDTGDNESVSGRGDGNLKTQYLWILQFLGQPGHKYPPVDEAPKNASFSAFRRKLVQAVQDRDSAFILGITDPEISLSGGALHGKPEFKQDWKISEPNSPFWPIMKRILSVGGGWVPGYEKNTTAFQSPYTERKFPYKLADEKRYGIVTTRNAILRSAPSLFARPVKILSYDVVIPLFEESVGNQQGDDIVWEWARVVTAHGEVGYLYVDDLWTDSNVYAMFSKMNGRWMMTAFRPGSD